MPYQDDTWRFTLEDAGCPELWVEVREPRNASAAKRRELGRAEVTFRRMQQGGPAPGEEFADRMILAFDDFFREIAVDWNLPYPMNWPDEALRGTVIPIRYARRTPPKGLSADEKAFFEATEAELARRYNPLDPVPGNVFDALAKLIKTRLQVPPKSDSG